jgi:hypothetical protein
MTDRARWQRERDQRVAVDVAQGLGIRPPEWWEFESSRPDLADGAHDVYAGLNVAGGDPPPPPERSVDRLRYLARTGELTAGERAAINQLDGIHAWRRDLLREATSSRKDN